MSNFPENEKNEITQPELNNENTAEEFSTVFSDPTAHREVPQKKKRRLLAAIAAVLAVAIFAGGTIAVIKLIPEKEESTESPFAEDIVVTEISSSDLDTVTVKTELGTINLYSKREKSETESSESTSSTGETVNWYLEGVAEDLVDTSTVASFAGSAASISAMREITEKTAEECGLNNPVITVDTVDKNGEKFSVTVGGESPDKSGYYVKTSKDDKIYLVGNTYVDSLKVEPLYFASTSTMSAFDVPDGADNYLSDDGKLAYFDSITVNSKNFTDKLVVAYPPSDDELSQYIGYVVKEPTYRIAENAENLVSVFTNGVSVTGAYAYDVTNASLKQFGLDNPDFQMTMDIKGKKLTYKFAAQEDGNYAAVNDDSKLISKVSADSVSTFINSKIIDFYSSWICLYSIDDISNLNIRVGEKDYKFGITALSEEEAAEKDVNYAITLNGKDIDCQSFQNLYQYIVSFACTDYTVDKINAPSDVDFNFVFKDAARGTSVVKFTKASDTRYQYSVDGRDLGKINSASMNKLTKYLEKIAAGEIIPEIN